MLKMVDGTGIIGVDMICPLGVSTPQPPNYDRVELEGVGSLVLPNSLKAPLERLELIGNSTQGENPAPDNPKEIKSAGKHDEVSGKYLFDVKVTGENLLSNKSADWQIGKGLSWSTYPNDPISIYRVINSAVNVINLKPSTTYSIVNNSEKIVISRMIERNLSENGIKDHDVRSSKYTFATNQNTMNAILQIKKVDGTELLSSDIESIKIMLVEGEVNDPTPYEPYTEQSVQIALNEPLRGIGEYKDTITKDGVVRKIYEQTLKKERISMNEYNWDTKYFRLYVKPDKKIDSSTTITRLFSNMFKGFTICKGNSTIYWLISEEEIRSMGITEADCREVAYEKIKDFVTNNDIVVQYPIVETTLEPLSESVQAQLSALHSENGTTHVFVDSGEVPCGIKLTYRKEK